MRRFMLFVFLLGWSLSLFGQTDTVTFSQKGGFYEQSFTLSLHCQEGHHIHYTTNGGQPDPNSNLYEAPLTLDESLYSRSDIYTIVNCIPSTFHPTEHIQHAIIIRAAAFDDNDSCVSAITTHSYFIRSLGCDTHGLPVLSIAADSIALFDYETGIFVPGVHYDASDSTHTGNYYERGREWERLINLEFYETNNFGINQICGLRTHGGASRWFQQKGMRFYAREEYGKKRFKHRFFESIPIASFKRLVLHPFRCSNWLQTGGQEELSQRVAAQLNFESLGVRQTVVFINGEYWGLYTLEESPDERYLEDHYGVNLDHVNIIKWWGVQQYGDNTEWRNFRIWMDQEADLDLPEDSLRAFTQLDVESFIDYILFETFSANLDWPQNNTLLWQARQGSPFRFIFYDGDGCFTRWQHLALDHSIHQGGNSVVFKRLLTNMYFRQWMLRRFRELKQTHFSYESIKPYLEAFRDKVKDEIPAQSERFGFPVSPSRWETDMGKADEFLQQRMEFFEQELYPFLSTNDYLTVSFACFPNPSSGAFNIRFDLDHPDLLPLTIYDLTGQKVFSVNLDCNEGLNLQHLDTDLSAGMYLLRIGAITQRIVIQ